MKAKCLRSRLRTSSLVLGLAFLMGGGVTSMTNAIPIRPSEKKNTPDHFAVRSEQEGTSGVLGHIRIPHGCNGKPVCAMGVVFPNLMTLPWSLKVPQSFGLS